MWDTPVPNMIQIGHFEPRGKNRRKIMVSATIHINKLTIS